MSGLEGIQIGEKVIITGPNGYLAVADCIGIRATQARIRNHGAAMLKTGKIVASQNFARRGSEQTINDVEQEIERRLDERDRQEQAKQQAEYNALPEEIKLAKTLQYFFDTHGEKKVAAAPIEPLRQLVQWAVTTYGPEQEW